MREQYPGLGALSYGIRWLEHCLSILAEPLLVIGFVVSMVDLLVQGRLLSNVVIMYGWAIIQAIAVDACFVVTWRKAAVARRNGSYGVMIVQAIIGVVLGLVAWAAMDLQSLSQALGIGSNSALSQLGLNIELLTHGRSFIAVVMGAVVAISNSAAEQNTEHKPFVWPRWFRRTSKQIQQTIVTQEANTEHSPNELPEHRTNTEQQSEHSPNELPQQQAETEQQQTVRKKRTSNIVNITEVANKKEKIREVLLANNNASVSDIARSTGISKGYVSEQRVKILAEMSSVGSAISASK